MDATLPRSMCSTDPLLRQVFTFRRLIVKVHGVTLCLWLMPGLSASRPVYRESANVHRRVSEKGATPERQESGVRIQGSGGSRLITHSPPSPHHPITPFLSGPTQGKILVRPGATDACTPIGRPLADWMLVRRLPQDIFVRLKVWRWAALARIDATLLGTSDQVA